VVGLKPTYGRVSRYGLIAMGSSLDSPGPITKTVNDAALLLQVIAGKDKYDATTSSKPVPNYTSEMKKNRKFVIGISDDYLENVDRSVVLEFERLISILKKSGHKLKKIKLINPKYAISLYTILHRAEVSSNLARFDGVRFGHNRSSFAKQAKRRMTLGAYALSVGYYDQYYLKAQKVRTLIINNFIEAFKSVDLIFAPTTPTTALKVGESEGNPMFGEMMDVLVEASSIAGLPGINIPTTIASGLPVGMQIFGPWFEEGKILDLSFQLQNELEFYNFKPKNYYGI
jgi:aspartyl-tRNA(Asn)/glutamyl-tRNA(Gln) amidotransferase subunit A